jgi:UDP-N-acetylglucosamine--N-acetylmuramyl-(pentapeptide) pyrophosphoryl-undecaprenol N-acetylglucosamine transferase
VIIAAGGTAGHVVPALAVADALSERGATVSFAGTSERAEAELVPAHGYEIDFLDLRGLDRRNPIKAALAVGKAALAVRAAGKLLQRRGADLVMGGGGYVAGPVGLAAIRRRLPLVLTEADSHLGITNRVLARRARRVCLAFELPGRDGERYLHTGRAVPRAILEADRGEARAELGIPADARCLLIFGGSLGARSINEAALAAFSGPGAARRSFHVVHISGARDYETIRERLGASAGYTLIEYLPDIGAVLAAADLVVARSGGSVLELAAAGVPAILIPYPHATAAHQHANARWMADAGAAIVLDDDDLSAERIASAAAALIGDESRLREMAAASRSIAKPDAAERIAAEILGPP